MKINTNIVFSLIVPTRGRPDLLKQCIDSFFLNANNPELVEMVVIIDHDDPTASEICTIVSSRIRWPIILVSRRRSKKMIRDYHNFGAQCSSGKYIWILNDECQIAVKGWDEIIGKKIEDFLQDKPDRLLYVSMDDDTHSNWAGPGLPSFIGTNIQYICGCCFPIVSKETVDVVNGIFPAEIDMWEADSRGWELMLSLPLGRVLWMNEIGLTHNSSHNKKRELDSTQKWTEEISINRGLTPEQKLDYVVRLALYQSKFFQGSGLFDPKDLIRRSAMSIIQPLRKAFASGQIQQAQELIALLRWRFPELPDTFHIVLEFLVAQGSLDNIKLILKEGLASFPDDSLMNVLQKGLERMG